CGEVMVRKITKIETTTIAKHIQVGERVVFDGNTVKEE
ncbi:hypothetical protein LCGC14_1991460, partial [marine sediment metagenome]